MTRLLHPGGTLQVPERVHVQVYRDAQLRTQLVQGSGDGAAQVAEAAVRVMALGAVVGGHPGRLGQRRLRCLLQQGEGVTGVGEDAEGPGAQHLLRAPGLFGPKDLCDALHRRVEVAGVEGLEPAGQVHGALVQAPHVHPQLGAGAALPGGGDLRGGVGDLLLQPVHGRGPAVPVLGLHPGVRDLLGHLLRKVLALAGRGAGTVRAHLQLPHPRVQVGMAVLEVHCVGDLPARGGRGAAQQACHVQAQELRHARGAVTHRDLLLHQGLHDVVVIEAVTGGQLCQQHHLACGHELGQLVHLEELLGERAGNVFHE
ncbi:hypothetical protein [Tessaracoccus terricola]